MHERRHLLHQHPHSELDSWEFGHTLPNRKTCRQGGDRLFSHLLLEQAGMRQTQALQGEEGRLDSPHTTGDHVSSLFSPCLSILSPDTIIWA